MSGVKLPAYVTEGRRTEGGGFGVEIAGMPEVLAMLHGYMAPELDAKLALGLKAAGRVMAKSVRQAAGSRLASGVRPGFRKGTSHKAGDLYRSIGSRTLRGNPIAVAVGPVRRHSGMRHLAIRPTRAHVISSDRGFIWAGDRFTRVAHHPGNHAHPWVASGIRSAREQAKDAAANAIFHAVLTDPASGADD